MKCDCLLKYVFLVVVCNKLTFRCPQWTRDEKVCARNVNNEIVFYEDNDFGIVYLMHIVGYCRINIVTADSF